MIEWIIVVAIVVLGLGWIGVMLHPAATVVMHAHANAKEQREAELRAMHAQHVVGCRCALCPHEAPVIDMTEWFGDREGA